MVFFEGMKMFRLQSEYEAQISEWGALEAIVLQQDRWVSVFFFYLSTIFRWFDPYIMLMPSVTLAGVFICICQSFSCNWKKCKISSMIECIADICHNHHNQWWCTFFKPVPILHRERESLAYFGQFGLFVANLLTFWCICTGLNNAL